ncbi:MAG: Daunorubicin resistance ABC transporter ATPase subunit [Methanoculleus marisnigri]|uniref:Daunorubicin resistance ABC transporter ATPase subunit n=1 Tax=Methanoculleus marisnigri TaxID=2198 RepID=A0A101IT56_9EURY|nr:MAG: Daunorubicin resistance ABC transporter ATPase subunit [Methanoculleus marisnigri]
MHTDAPGHGAGPTPAIHVNNLTKSFDGFTAVDGISFTIENGEIFGLLGPNGAGKTTTISMLATMQKPTSGTATVNGHDIVTDEDNVRRSIGIVFQDQSLDEELTAYENMDFHGRLYRIGGEERRQRIDELLTLVELEDRKDDLVKTYSGGMRRRLEIARGLLHEPKVLFLDEPTLGLDPQTRNHLWEYIARLNEEKGITIILTTHYMEEADRLCDRVAIIDRGTIVALDTVENLKASIGGDVVTIASVDPGAIAGLLAAPWISGIECHDGLVTIRLQDADQHIPGIVTAIHQKGIGITSLSVHKPTFEDVFLHYTGRTIREEETSGNEATRMFHRARRR